MRILKGSDEHIDIIENALHRFLVSCGCGQTYQGFKVYYDFLKHMPNYEDSNKIYLDSSYPDIEVRTFILWSLSNQDLIEHGSTIYGSWLTEKGKRILRLLEYYMKTIEEQEA